MCKVQGYMACQRSTSRKQVRSNGRWEVVGATLRGEPGVGGRNRSGGGRGSPYRQKKYGLIGKPKNSN